MPSDESIMSMMGADPRPSESAKPGSMHPACSAARAYALRKSIIPVNPEQWTVDDWRDLHKGILSIKAKISKRHIVPQP